MVHQCWQLDSFVWPLTDGSNAAVYQLEDDRSRFVIASLAERGETSAGAVRVVDCGIAAFQVPQVLLTDNGSAFNATRRGSRSRLVEHLTLLGVQCITGRPGHPQTQGKNERIHQSTQRWLRAQPRAGSIAQLQAQIEQFDDYYNHHRPHQSLRMRTPPTRPPTLTRLQLEWPRGPASHRPSPGYDGATRLGQPAVRSTR